ncbi:MAG: hypothetical protein H6Q05_4379, partial [Acidobacteria bacterium]|nr:hypothetical protein [Acidobacteriota bacterium]
HHSHSALPDLLHDSEMRDGSAGKVNGAYRAGQGIPAGSLSEQVLHFPTKISVRAAGVCEVFLTLAFSQLERGMENLLDQCPTLGDHAALPFENPLPDQAGAMAHLQSRVRGEISNTSFESRLSPARTAIGVPHRRAVGPTAGGGA